MIEDKELDALSAAESVKEKSMTAVVNYEETNSIAPDVVIETQFSKTMDVVKENVLNNAATEDQQFIDTVRKNVKEAAVTLTNVEKKKAEYQEHEVEAKDEELDTKRKKNQHVQDEDVWENKKKKRQYHYDGVKDIMEFVGIKNPMNLFFLYFLSAVFTPLFLLGKICKCTFGNLLTGANDKDRGKAARGFLWTLLCLFSVIVVICIILLFLKTQGIDVFAKIKC